jgi:hypothetical protein
MWKINYPKIIQSLFLGFDNFIDDFFNYVISQDPNLTEDDIETNLVNTNSPLGKLSRTKVKKYIVRFVKCPERHMIVFYYYYYKNNYEKILDGCFYLDNNLTEETKLLINEAFNYFYEELPDKKTFQINYLDDYRGPKSLKREIRLQFGKNIKVCPYCDINNIRHPDYSSIDHFLPRKHFPLLSIFSKNLIISCGPCNDRIKKDKLHVPIIYPILYQIADFIKFKFDRNCDHIDLKVDGATSLEIISIVNFCKMFKLKEVYALLSDKIKTERKRIRDNVINQFKLIDPSMQTEKILRELFLQELFAAKEDNYGRKVKFELTKLKEDLYNHILSNIDDDIEFLLNHFKILNRKAINTEI